MENRILDKFKDTIKIKVSGKNIDRFIKRLYKNNIEILSLKNINRNTIIISIYLNDYNNVMRLKSIYEINDVGVSGLIKFKNYIYKNRFMIISLIIGYFVLLFLSNVIFEVQVIHSDTDLRNFVVEELERYDIKKYSFKKDFKKLNEITNKITEENKDKIEWLSIENIGTKVQVKLEERKLNPKEKVYDEQNIVATKSGIIKKVVATNGVIVKNINDYVTKGDVVISGEIMDTYNEKLLNKTSALGSVYAEVWYTVNMEYPLIYSVKKETKKSKKVYEIQFLNNKFSLFDFNPYKYSKDTSKIILENPIMPFKILRTTKKELEVQDEVNILEEALVKANNIAREKIESKLDENEYIIKQKNLSFYEKDSKIVIEIFFSVYESIGEAKEIIDKESINKEQVE